MLRIFSASSLRRLERLVPKEKDPSTMVRQRETSEQ